MPPNRIPIRILGIGNLLMGDEGVGVHVVRYLQEKCRLPEGVDCLDGGTGSLVLLETLQTADRIILVDATMDGNPPGTLRRLVPKFSSDFPPSLAAHDIGLRDLLDSFYLLGDEPPDVILFTISIAEMQNMVTALSPEVSAAVPLVAAMIIGELAVAPNARA
jgi:hydrogenase maturation protease